MNHAMAYDSARGVAVLFGGQDGGNLLNDTWEWDGMNWMFRPTAVAPSARDNHRMAYDSARGVTVLFGGFDGAASGQTWEWDGANWRMRIPAPSPPPQEAHAMAYDSARRMTVFFGGGQTWEWVGPNATIAKQPVAQSVVAGQAAAFSITATSAFPLFYQWFKDGDPLADGGAVSGSAGDTLTISPAAGLDAGLYECRVANGCGIARSSAALLSVDVCTAIDATSDCNGNGILDSCDIAADASLDSNGNGMIDSCEVVPAGGGGGSASCGTCGGGAATMMPMTLFALLGISLIRSRRKS
jgi:hypothetical protein